MFTSFKTRSKLDLRTSTSRNPDPKGSGSLLWVATKLRKLLWTLPPDFRQTSAFEHAGIVLFECMVNSSCCMLCRVNVQDERTAWAIYLAVENVLFLCEIQQKSGRSPEEEVFRAIFSIRLLLVVKLQLQAHLTWSACTLRVPGYSQTLLYSTTVPWVILSILFTKRVHQPSSGIWP